MDEESTFRESAPNTYSISRRRFLQAMSAVPVLGLAWASAEGAAAPPNFSFVYVTDTHLVTGQPDSSFKMLQESQLFLQESIKAINSLKPDFVIFGGDQVEGPGKDDKNWQLFIDLAQGLHCPWYFVLGESDTIAKPPADKMKTFGLDWKGRGNTGTTPYWSADPMPGLHLIGLDTSISNNNAGELDEDQLKWLKSDLTANRGKFTIVVSHHPLLAPPPYDGGSPWDEYVLPNGADAREVLATSPDVRMVLSGHLYLNKIQLENNVFHISSAGLNVYPCEYKYFAVNKTGIMMQSFEVPFPALIKKANKALAASSLSSKYNRQKSDAILALCEGEEQDQNAFMSLGSNKTVRALSKKELKDQQKSLEEAVQKEKDAAAAKKGGKDDKASDKKSDDKRSDDKKSDDKNSNDKKPSGKKSGDAKSDDKGGDSNSEDKKSGENTSSKKKSGVSKSSKSSTESTESEKPTEKGSSTKAKPEADSAPSAAPTDASPPAPADATPPLKAPTGDSFENQ